MAPARPRSPSRTVPNTVRVPSTLNRRRTTRCGLPCGAVCGAVPLGRRSRRPLIQLPPRPRAVAVAVAVVADAVPVHSPSSRSLFRSSLKLPASSSLMLSSIANLAPTAPSKRSVESRPASPQPNLAHLLSVSQKPPPPVPPSQMLSPSALVLSCRPHRRCCGRRRSRTLATPRLPDETRPRLSSRRAPTRTPLLASRPEPSSRCDQPDPSSCVSPPTATPPSPERDTRPTFLERTQTEPSTERIQTKPSSSATTPHSPLSPSPPLTAPPPRPLSSSLSRSSLKLSLPSLRRSPPVSSSIDHRILVLPASPLTPVPEAPPVPPSQTLGQGPRPSISRLVVPPIDNPHPILVSPRLRLHPSLRDYP